MRQKSLDRRDDQAMRLNLEPRLQIKKKKKEKNSKKPGLSCLITGHFAGYDYNNQAHFIQLPWN